MSIKSIDLIEPTLLDCIMVPTKYSRLMAFSGGLMV